MDKKKSAFLILRVEESFKKRLVRKAKAKGKSISEYVRGLLKNI